MYHKIGSILEKYNKSTWIMYNSDGCDKFFNKYISNSLNTKTFCIVTKSKTYIVVQDLDKDNLSFLSYNKDLVSVFVYNEESKLMEILEYIFADELKFPKEVCATYSTLGDNNIDILTHGKFIELKKIIKTIYTKYNKKFKFSSAENIVYEIESKKNFLELTRLKLLADLTVQIIEETIKNLYLGITEKEIVELTVKNMNIIMQDYIGTNDMLAFDVAWENAPIVLIGKNLVKSGHSLPSDLKLKPNNVVYFDFGIKVEFTDGMILYTDLQRMAYTLNKKQKKAPKGVEKVFDTLVESIEEGMEELKPGKKGYEVDKVTRNTILKAGYPDYNHASGHPVGREVHDAGAVISKKMSKRAKLQIIEDAVYTLEPRIAVENGGSIEEMIIATKYGGKFLSRPQKKLYYIK